MPDDRTMDGLPDTTPLHHLLGRTRRLLRASWLVTGLGLTLGVFLGILVTAGVLDLLAPVVPEIRFFDRVALPGSVVRLLALLAVVVPAAWIGFTGIVRPLFRRLDAARVARRIESHLPGIHNRLVSAADLTAGRAQPASPAFYRRLLTEALDRVRDFTPRTVVDFLSLRRAGLAAAGGLTALLLAGLFFSDRLPTAFARIFLPFADIPPASSVAYTVRPGNGHALRGDEIPFVVQVDKGEPEKLWLEMTGPDVKPLRHDLVKQPGGAWALTLAGTLPTGFDRGFSYRVFGGDTWSPRYRLDLVERPSIVGMHTVLHFPPYMAIPEPRVNPPESTEVTGPEGSAVEVVVQAEGDVKEAEIQFLEPRRRPAHVKERPDRVWLSDRAPPGAAVDGDWRAEAAPDGRRAHTVPAAHGLFGVHRHLFQAAPGGFPVAGGEILFANVYVVPGKEPEAIMLEWQDADGWDHRAFWGADRIREGKLGTTSRRRLGDLPPSGRWVRLEVPAEAIGVEGKALTGMAFKLYGGACQCYWGEAGVEELELGARQTFPMTSADGKRWSGRFPLHGSGFYRVELRSPLGHANKTMKEAKYTAVPDQPPQLVLEQPKTDVVLSQPGKVPLEVAAYDDYGLAGLTLLVRRGSATEPERRPLREYEKPRRDDRYFGDIALQEGDSLRCQVEARDRKGQTALSPEFVLRVAADPNAADKQLTELEKSQDTFREKLVKLIGDQEKVQAKLEKVNAQFAPAVEKVRAAQVEAQKKAAASSAEADPIRAKDMAERDPTLDPEAIKALQALQKELGELAQQEAKNTNLGKEVAADLAKAAEQADKLATLPREMQEQLKALQGLFQQNAVQPLQNLTTTMQQAAAAKPQNTPDLKGMEHQANRLQQELAAMKQRMDALAQAQKELRNDSKQALAGLRREMRQQDLALNARRLEELRDYLAAMKEALKGREGEQKDLQETTQKTSDGLLGAAEKEQTKLEGNVDRDLTKMKDLQAAAKAAKRRPQRRPNLPGEPYDPENGEKMERPRELDSDDPDEKKKATDAGKEGEGENKKDEKKDGKEDEEKFLMPALGGPKPKVDPRFANRQRPPRREAKTDPKDGKEMRADLEARQDEQMNRLDQAQQALNADQQSLEKTLQRMQQAMQAKGKPQGRETAESPEGTEPSSLQEMLESQVMQQALAMANRARQQQQGQQPGQQPNPGQPQQAASNQGNLQGGPLEQPALESELAKLDPDARSVILKMPPRLREELLQGMREEGPEAYRKLIQRYYKALTDVKK